MLWSNGVFFIHSAENRLGWTPRALPNRQPQEDRKGGLLYMPVAYILRLTDAHHVLAGVAKEAGVSVPAMPGGSFNPCSSMVQSVDTTRNFLG
eukprot:s50_g70.t1